ncbi:glycosyltransferase [Paenibacillus arenilitoris]|uniref:Glycosyltransferase n=1 Tax=Paenibacillus arenilitoris TaxID=2772299 RepID=A0A927CPX2_9BACL|nr:glycosyltransferase [Paenibacillus arenilitoris]MBD2872038.1 glycosyltransferase [Paenibacillus arenilitoris]
MDVKISVIIPVYNAEPYIADCVQSLLGQTLQACEFIFVDDGSTDKSGLIIESYRLRDDRIKLITQENQGVSAARNAGLRAAAGEYAGFVDADDYIAPDMYETLYLAAAQRDCDVVVSNFESEIEGAKVVTAYPFRENAALDRDYIRQHMMPYFLQTDDLNTAVNKIYRLSVLRRHRVAFPEKVALGEDCLFNMLFFGHAASAFYLNYSGYYYREVSGSATRNIGEKDYFGKALEVFLSDPPPIYDGLLPAEHVNELKSVRLIKSMLSYIYIYLKPSKEMSFRSRYRYVKRMIANKHVRAALPLYWKGRRDAIGRYEKCLLFMVKARLTPGLLAAVVYSRSRNF